MEVAKILKKYASCSPLLLFHFLVNECQIFIISLYLFCLQELHKVLLLKILFKLVCRYIYIHTVIHFYACVVLGFFFLHVDFFQHSIHESLQNSNICMERGC